MSKRIMWLVLALVLFTAVGCTAQTLPVPDGPQEDAPALEPAAGTAAVDTPTTAAQAEDTPSSEPAVEATAVDTATAEALKEILESELLETPTQPASLTPILEEVIQLQPTSSKPDPQAMQQISYAKADLAQRLGVDSSAIVVVAYEEITWRDGSLGCPQPGMMYTQALVGGYVIQLQVDGQVYNYHGADGREPFLCTNDAGTPESTPPDLSGGELSTPPVQEE